MKAVVMGRDGKGEKDNYEWFCNWCFVEYGDIFKGFSASSIQPGCSENVKAVLVGVDASASKRPCCNRCKKPLVTKSERHSVLKDKVEVYKREKGKSKSVCVCV